MMLEDQHGTVLQSCASVNLKLGKKDQADVGMDKGKDKNKEREMA